MNYVMSCLGVIGTGAKQIKILARGKAISKAVDVSEILKHQRDDVVIKSLTTGSQSFEATADRRASTVSTIEIILNVGA
jgi:DNA-binding protein